MKTNSYIKKFTSTFVALILFFASIVGFLTIFKSEIKVYAMEAQSVPNGSFTSFSSNSKMPSNFTCVPNDLADSNVTTGVIDISTPEYLKFNTFNDRKDDYKVLQISTVKEDKKSNTAEEEPAQKAPHYTYFGYENSEALSLNESSYYRLSVDVYTDRLAGIGLLYLLDTSNNEVVSEINNIGTNCSWLTYSFYIATKNEGSLNLKLGLFLNGSGTILFDDVNLFKLNESEFNTQKAADKRYVEYVADTASSVLNMPINDSMFNESYSSTELDHNPNNYAQCITVASGEGYDGTHSTAFLINNETDFAQQHATSKNFLELDANSVYRISVFAKAVNVSGSANLKLIETTNEDDGDDNTENYESDTITFSNTDSAFKNYSFFVRTFAHTLETAKIQLVVGLGDSSSTATGSVYITNIAVSKVSYSSYNSASSPNVKFDLVSKYEDENKETEHMLDNGNFNKIEVGADYTNQYPATPSGWTVTKGDETHTQKYGVINTAKSEWNKLTASYAYYSNLSNPNDDSVSNNVLMMYNASKNTLSYTSPSHTVSAEETCVFNLSVLPRNSNLKIDLVTEKDGSEIVLGSVNVAKSSGTNGWQTIQLEVAAGYQDLDVSLKITLDSDADAYAFIDNVYVDYANAPHANITESIDLKNLLASTNNFSYDVSNSNVNTNIVDLASNANTAKQMIALDSEDATYTNNTNVLSIKTNNDYYTNYTVTSNLGYYLTSNNYYKIIVYVYTENLKTENTDNAQDVGVSIGLTGFEKGFTKIQSNEHWTRYAFYINPDNTSTSYLTFTLGSEDVTCAGSALFGNIIFDKIEEDEFNNHTENARVLVLKETISDEDSDDTTDETTDATTNSSAWIYAIPSLLFAAAIIICVVGVMARKIKWKKFTKRTKNEYDRNKTVSKQYYMRKATAMREEKLRDLNKELEKLTSERTQYEEEYKQDLTKLRDLKIHRASQSEINKLDKEMKKNRRLSAAVGVNINSIANEIEYTKTEQYLNNLAKKLASSPLKEDEPEAQKENNKESTK